MQCACACVHVYVRGLHALDDLLGVDFRPCTRPQRADAPAFAHPLIITHVRAHMFNHARCNACVRACRWLTCCCALTATSWGSVFALVFVCTAPIYVQKFMYNVASDPGSTGCRSLCVCIATLRPNITVHEVIQRPSLP